MNRIPSEGMQQQLTKARRPGPLDDLTGVLPGGVLPTRCYILERNGHALIIKMHDHRQDITPAQQRMWEKLSRNPRLSVLCVWGNAHSRHALQRFSDGSMLRQVLTSGSEAWKREIRDWWADVGRMR